MNAKMSEVLKKKMEKYHVDMNKEIKEFLGENLMTYEILDILNEVVARAEKRKVVVDSAKLIRDSRLEQ